MATSKGEIQQQTQDAIENSKTTITDGTKEGGETVEELGNTSNASLSRSYNEMAKSKSISVINVTSGEDLIESSITHEKITDQKVNEDAMTKSNKSNKRDRTHTIEFLNLQTKPRFQRMTTDMFRTFMTRKSVALELEKVELKPEPSEVLVMKYPMLQGPVLHPKAPSPSKHKSQRTSRSSIHYARGRSVSRVSKIPNFIQKRADSSKSVEEKCNKTDHDTLSTKSATETLESAIEENVEGRNENKKSKHKKREHKRSKKPSDDSELHQIVQTKKEGKSNKFVSISTPEVAVPSEHPDEMDKLSVNNIKKTKKRIAHKEQHSKKSKMPTLKGVASDENISSFETEENETVPLRKASVINEILDDRDNPEWNMENEITIGEMIREAESDDILIFQIVSEIMSTSKGRVSPIEDLEHVKINKGGDESEVRSRMDEEHRAPADTNLPREASQDRPLHQHISRSRSKPKIYEKGIGDSVSWTFLNKTKDRIFKEFMRTETPTKNEEPAEPRRSYFDYPSVVSVNEEGLNLHAIDNAGSVNTLKSAKEDSSKALLPAVSITTARLLGMYEPNVEPKDHRKWAEKVAPAHPLTAFEDMKSEPIDQKTLSNLDALTELLSTLKDQMDAGETSKICQCKGFPCSKDEDNELQRVKFLPDQFTHDDFMKYFCKDWTKPEESITPEEKDESIKGGCTAASVTAEAESNLGEDGRSRFSDILDKIEDDEIYDLIFTYRLPKTAPFDLKDTVNEARFKCIHKWLVETGNTMYRSVFEEEVKAKAEERINALLMKKVVSLQNKIKRCDVCNKPPSSLSVLTNATSVSTFSNQEDTKEPIPFIAVEPPTNTVVEDISAETNLSDMEIKHKTRLLMRQLQLSIMSYEDGEVLENPYTEINVTAKDEKDGKTDHPSTIPKNVTETRASRRRREIRELLDKLIELLEKKLNHMKTRQILVYKGEDEEGEVVTIEKELSFKSCHCQDDEEEDRTSQLTVDHLDAILKNFPINISGFLTKRSVCRKPTFRFLPKEQDTITFTKRNRIQLYLLNYSNTWHPLPTECHDPPSENVEDMRLTDKLERHKKYKKPKPRIPVKKRPPVKEISDTDLPEENIKSRSKRPSAEEPRRTKIPFTCSCFCDRVSRFNPKRNQHFRTVLNDHFWCLRTDARLLEDGYDGRKSAVQVPNQWSLCPPEAVEEPDNFQGWLADTDRNLLLLMSRPPLNRIDKDYYKKTTVEKKVQLPLLEEVDDEHVLKERQLIELVNQLSKAQAAKFWETVDRWYEDYKKRDKVRQMLELFQDVDLNAMLQRDLTMMKDGLAKQLEETKEEVRIRVEREKKEKFENDLKKLRAAYSCHLKNRLEAKKKEMESKKAFLVRCMLIEAKENFAPVIEKYKKKCTEWIETLRDKQNATSLTVKQRKARQLALIADKCDVAERVRRKLLGATGKEHEEVEKVLGQAIESRDIVIEGLKSSVINLTRDVNIWKRAVGEVLKSFKKFVYYILETRPDRAQYVLSLERLYQLQMDDLIRDAKNELEKVETNEIKPTARPSETLQPTMEIKCPSHDIRYPSEHSGKTGSSSDTDIDEDIRARKVVDHTVDAAIRTVLPTPEPTVGEEEEDENDLEELEQLISLWEHNSQELKIESVSSEEVCEDEQTEHERLVRVIGEGASDPCISVEEFTKRRIREMLEIIARKKPLIRSHVNL